MTTFMLLVAQYGPVNTLIRYHSEWSQGTCLRLILPNF
jgi:hypothetical protein